MRKAAKVVIIGAGSAIFTKTILCDLLQFDDITIGNISLVDIDEKKLDVVCKMTNKMVRQTGKRIQVVASKTWVPVLENADYVINAISVGGAQIYKRDLDIAEKFGVSDVIGDIIGPTGIFRMLRAYPVILQMVKDMERLCPNAYFFNYTNPMAPICQALNEQSTIKIFGFCHSVQGTAKMLAEYLDVKPESMSYWVAGINHMAWYLQLKTDGEDAYPMLRRLSEDPQALKEAFLREKKYQGYVGTEF
ncbi:MAG: alpha-glucosidase/alpha-galactosidase, partial [Lachnospiraceae bacterium]|nr:alpha-glucosidase/alpha-galactosidase [Lachnospiraceae bacterium]